MKKIWFKAKRYGYGWYPATWQGWLVFVCFVAALVINVYRVESKGLSDQASVLIFVPETLIFVIILIYICYKKGEPTRWRWGEDKKESENQDKK
jgi:uncharacterized membrane protein YhaH (DUF805 family)